MRKFLLACSSGLLFALGWPTYGIPLLLFFAFVPLLVMEHEIRRSDTKRKKLKIFGLAYTAFFIWNLITTSWLIYASIFGASFAIFVNSALMALAFLIYHLAAKRSSINRGLLFLIVLWISFEKLHLGWEFSWPWLNLGNGFSEVITWIQWYEFTGTFGGTLWVLLVNSFVYKSVLAYQSSPSRQLIKKKSIVLVLMIFIPIGVSLVQYATYEHEGDDLNVLILQPNIDPYEEKYALENLDIINLFNDMISSEITDSTDLIVAPETVFAQNVPLKTFETSLLLNEIKKLRGNNLKTDLLTGVSFIDVFQNPQFIKSQTNQYNANTWYDDYNSAVLLNKSDSVQYYHKSKLVVGVENFPYQSVLKPILGDAMIDLGGTVAMKTTQDERGVFVMSDTLFKAAPIICYESVYGEFVTGYVRNGANFLAIVTNDAWWNETQGHKQHLSYARLRAIEARRDIVRSANTGISAIINSRGNVTSKLGYGEKGVLTGPLKTNTRETFYVLAGDYIARISVFILIFVFLITFFRKPRP